MTKKVFFLALILCQCLWGQAQNQKDSLTIRRFFDETLTVSESHNNLRELCKNIGARLSGSPEAEKAVKWAYAKLKSYGLDTVYLQEVKVPRWERGQVETFSVNGKSLRACSLGGSVGTDGVLEGEIIEVRDFEELEKLGKSKIKGKIVFINAPLDPKLIDTFHAYSACGSYRYRGASNASEYGAKAVVIRSLASEHDDFPHTGSMGYAKGAVKIPAMAISTNDADYLEKQLRTGTPQKAKMAMDCQTLPDVTSYNVIAELKGKRNPERILLVGGHLDSWDKGEGAHDDGAGVVHSMEAIRLFKRFGIRPNNTLRCILFMNEENGNRGGETYAKQSTQKGEKHLAALESDRGGLVPRGFSVDAPQSRFAFLQQQKIEDLLKPYNLHVMRKGYGGVDINPLKKYGEQTLIGFLPDPQRYFQYHHSDNDVFENVDRRELELGSASIASLLYLIDKYEFGVVN
ncbi:peptidase M28 [Fulvitalea axinellae]|uniref:Carboxypeptidase Q n=1 Tax=Fulvitalea axinellae TaxID=1182444 RepID=A0AAU9D8Z4_9BACT|nr:peptidase M28 [Fulvitalea axinellae]